MVDAKKESLIDNAEDLLNRADRVSKELFGTAFSEMIDKEQFARGNKLLGDARNCAWQLGWKKHLDGFVAHFAAAEILARDERIAELKDALTKAGVPIPAYREAEFKVLGMPYPGYKPGDF
jgi:hypothetical protein